MTTRSDITDGVLVTVGVIACYAAAILLLPVLRWCVFAYFNWVWPIMEGLNQ